MSSFVPSNRESLNLLLAQMKKEQQEHEEKMSSYYNFDFHNDLPFQPSSVAQSAAEQGSQCRFVWESIAPRSEEGSLGRRATEAEAENTNPAASAGKIMAGFCEGRSDMADTTDGNEEPCEELDPEEPKKPGDDRQGPDTLQQRHRKVPLKKSIKKNTKRRGKQ